MAVVIIIGAVTAVSCGQRTSAPPETVIEGDALGVDPDVADLPVLERVSRSVTTEGVLGVLEGRVTSTGEALQLNDVPHDVVTRFEFEVDAIHAPVRGGPPQQPGTVIDLVVPGGRLGSTLVSVEDAPELVRGQRLLVWVQVDAYDTDANAGTADRVIVSSHGHEARIIDGMVQWSSDEQVRYDDVVGALEGGAHRIADQTSPGPT